MADLFHQWGSDLSLGPTGDLATADTPTVTTQRVLRRLLSNPGDYIWQLGYGAGLPRMVGQPANAAAIRGVITSQMYQEAGVSQDPAPAVKVKGGMDGTVFAAVQYTDAATNETQAVPPIPLS